MTLTSFFFFIIVFFIGFISTLGHTSSLKLGMYPYLPSVNRFQQIITEKWSEIHPEVYLEVDPFNCYHNDRPPSDFDAFIIDNILLQYYIKKGLINPLRKSQVENVNNFFQFAIDSVLIPDGKGDDVYCVPIFGCSFILYYRSSDVEIDENVKSVEDLYDIIGNNWNLTSPAKSTGLLFQMTSKNDMLSTYLMSEEYISGSFTKNPPLPWTIFGDDPSFDVLRKFVKMVGVEISRSKSFDMVSEFQKGNGRALIGFTETLAEFDPDFLRSNDLKMKPIPLHRKQDLGRGSVGDLFDLFFVDSLCMSPTTKSKDLVLQLMNMVVSEEVMGEILIKGGGSSGESPQFVIPSRNSTLWNLGKQNTYYKKIWDLIENTRNKKFFLVGDDIVDWMKSDASDLFMDQIFNISSSSSSSPSSSSSSFQRKNF